MMKRKREEMFGVCYDICYDILESLEDEYRYEQSVKFKSVLDEIHELVDPCPHKLETRQVVMHPEEPEELRERLYDYCGVMQSIFDEHMFKVWAYGGVRTWYYTSFGSKGKDGWAIVVPLPTSFNIHYLDELKEKISNRVY
jgi:hypothetical protein